MGFLQRALVSKRLFGDLTTYCKHCKKKESFKIIDGQGTHTLLCGCGCTIYRFHFPDENNKTSFFVKSFVPKKFFKKEFKDKDSFEKNGFEKKNGKYIK